MKLNKLSSRFKSFKLVQYKHNKKKKKTKKRKKEEKRRRGGGRERGGKIGRGTTR